MKRITLKDTKMGNRSYLVPRPPAFDHEHPRPKEEGEVLYCNTPFVGYALTRHNAFLYARDEIRKALAAAVDERGAGNPFLPQRDELVTQDMHTCDLCGRWCSSPVYSIGLIYGGQAKTFTEVCADCMWRLKFSPVRTISLDAYRLFERWRLSQSEADE